MAECKNYDKLHSRINRIIGQLKAIDKMIEEDAPCDKIIIQVNAVKGAVHNIGKEVFKGHAQHCIKDSIKNGNLEEGLEDFERIVDQFSKLS